MKQKKATLTALSAAAMALSSLSGQTNAEPTMQEYSFEYLATHYKEGDIPVDNLASGRAERSSINSQQVQAVIPLADDSSVSLTGLLESMTGASARYVMPGNDGRPVQVMSDAAIEETRAKVDVSSNRTFDASESTTSFSYSKGSDYDALTFGISGARFFNQNRMSISYGLNGGQAYIHPAQDGNEERVKSEAKNQLSGFMGLSQIRNKNRLIGVDFGWSSFSGYLSDPYEQAYVGNTPIQDSRPDRKQSFRSSLMWREFVPEKDGAFHANVGFFSSNWGITAFSGETSWYQNLGDWQLVPTLRLYHQSAASFYAPYYLEERQDGYYSSDARLSEFTSASGRFKVSKEWKYASFQLSMEHYVSFGDHPGLVDFNVISIGISRNL